MECKVIKLGFRPGGGFETLMREGGRGRPKSGPDRTSRVRGQTDAYDLKRTLRFAQVAVRHPAAELFGCDARYCPTRGPNSALQKRCIGWVSYCASQ